MSANPPERRRLDGPIRRQPIIAPASQSLSSAPTPASEPVFEYRKTRSRATKRRHWLRKVVAGFIVLILGTVGWFGYKTLAAAHKIIAHSDGVAPALAKKVDLTQLRGEGDGRVNILMMGIGGAGHDGANLSDTIMVVSIDPKTKTVAMLSVPRDLYVQIPGHGYGKINAANSYGGPALARQVVEQVTGIPIHYYSVVDFSGFKQAVDAVGGVDITVQKPLSDPYYPCDDGTKLAGKYCPINFAAGPQHMTGTQALEFARSRETTSDFDRAARQQLVIVALRQKALQLSTLTNPLKLTGLIDAIGDHVKTDLQLDEIKTLAGIAKDIDTTKLTSKVLDADKPDSLLQGGSNLIPGAGYIELPKLGNFNYSAIHDFVKNIFVDHYIVDENAVVEVQNGTNTTGLAAQVVASLKAAHYNVLDPVSATGSYTKTVIYDYTNGKKPYTINYLEQRFGVKAQVMPAPSVSPSPAASPAAAAAPAPEIRIILGSDYHGASS